MVKIASSRNVVNATASLKSHTELLTASITGTPFRLVDWLTSTVMLAAGHCVPLYALTASLDRPLRQWKIAQNV